MTDARERLTAALADRYRIKRQLGEGGMATVYLATDLRHERPVAVKVLRPEIAAALGSERFLREIKTTAQLTHPHILPLLDSGGADDTLFYVMPYVDGESLRARLGREKQLPLDDALQIAREVADALSYAHSHGVIHRDIKPENILLEAGHAVVADFGIARAVSEAGGDRLTETGVTLGTPMYMSPEQAAGSKDLDGRSDLYSLACVLYEMLGGKPPFTGPTAESVVHQHLTVEPPSIIGLRPAVPAAVASALQRALAKTPADRFNPVAQFAEVLGGRGSLAAAPATAGVPAAAARPGWRRAALVALPVFAVAVLGLVFGARLIHSRAGPVFPRTAIAVLPLDNLSAQGPNAYFAGGLHDELLTELAKVGALTVIGRTSVLQYAQSTKRPREIGDELGVGSLVEGSVQIVNDRLRVNVQLLDTKTEAHIWAESYDRTLQDAFAVQSDIAQQIATAVGAALGGAEREALTAPPTANPLAYQLYLQGLDYFRRAGYQRGNLEAAQQLLERAVALDAGFALAHAALSEVHGTMFWFDYDPTLERATRQRTEAETALRLAPESPRGHEAMGLSYYWGQRDYRRALDEFRLAVRGAPGDGGLWNYIGYVERRLGEWDSVEVAYARATQLDPRNPNLFADLGCQFYLAIHRYPDAVHACNTALTLAPDFHWAAFKKANAYVLWKGTLDTLRAIIKPLVPETDIGAGEGTVALKRLLLMLLAHQADSLIAYAGAIRTAVVESQDVYEPRSLYAAWAHLLRGDTIMAHAAFDSARAILDTAVRNHPDDWRMHVARGQAVAGLGIRPEALREAQWLQQSDVYQRDRFYGPYLAESRAQILARIGERDSALAEIERILAGPSWSTSVNTLRLDPRWDPIRSDSRFQALLVKYAGSLERRR
jgi:eukaryotic-like serine/threonine-protein kinase